MTTCRIPDCGAETDGFMCRPCLRILERDLGDMQSLIEEVWRRAMGMARVYRANGRRQSDGELEAWSEEQGRIDARLRSREGRVTLPATRLMVDLDARTLLADAWNTLVGWARHLAESRGVSLPPADELCSWLLGNAASFRFDDAGPEAFDELRFLHGRLERAVDRSPSRVYAGPCQGDDCWQTTVEGEKVKRDVYAPFGPPGVEDLERGGKEFACDGFRSDGVGCGARYTWNDRRPWLASTITEMLVPIDAFLDALPTLFRDLEPFPKRHSVLGWIRDGRLMHEANDPVTGVPLYPGRDLLALVAAYQPHRYSPRRKAG